MTTALHASDAATSHTYTYVDEASRPLFDVVVECDPDGRTTVQQHAIDPSGTRGQTLGSSRLVLYRLPAIIQAARALTPIFVVQGERSAEAVESLGLVATTSPVGRSWSEAYSETLRGAIVIIVPDNDSTGERHAKEVLASLDGVAQSVRIARIPDLPASGNVADWVERGGSREQFLELMVKPRVSVAARPMAAPASDLPEPQLHPDARHGIFGRVLDVLEPSTEAEPAAILASLMVGFGAMCGPGPHTTRGPERFPAKDYALIVGASAKARKGTSWSIARGFLERVDNDFFSSKTLRLVTGLSTGEGLIARVRDDRIDPGGQHDPRLLAVETEFAKVLRVNDRQGNSLSPVLREAWDLGPLGSATKNEPVSSSVHHVCLIGHITIDELLSELDTVSIRNGFANRFVVCFASRKKLLSNPPELDETQVGLLAYDLRQALQAARGRQAMHLTPEASHMWAAIYPEIESRDVGGVVGDLTSRATAHILRLAVIYALADNCARVEPQHLVAAQAMWQYSEDSLRYIFGDKLGDPVAQRLLEALNTAGPDGLSATKQFELFARKITAERRQAAVQTLTRLGLAHERTGSVGPSGGRASSVLHLGPAPSGE